MKCFFLCLIFVFCALFQTTQAQTATDVKYPSQIKYLSLTIEKQAVRMAYMDAAPADKPNGRTVILFHGKNFNGFYWKEVIPMLTKRGFRVIVPDQIGWGKSDRPNIHYSFHQLAANNKKLLDSLGVKQAIVVGHSMGGMLAARFTLMYPETVSELVLENPIGLEDYKTFVPYSSLEEAEATELKATAASVTAYQKTYFPVWKTEYQQYADAQAADLKLADYAQVAFVNALTFQMIYEQPVIYEFERIAARTLLIVGQEDRTVVGKNKVPKETVNNYGNYPRLGRAAKARIKNSQLIELSGVGHIPHIQTPEKFEKAIVDFLEK